MPSRGRSWCKKDLSDVYIWLSPLEIQTYIRARIHYDNVTWAPRHLKSPETRQFIQSWTRLITKKIPQNRITGRFCDVMQNVFISWRHNESILVSSLLGNRSKIMWTLRAYSCLQWVLHMTRESASIVDAGDAHYRDITLASRCLKSSHFVGLFNSSPGWHHRKHQWAASLSTVRGIYWSQVVTLQERPVIRKASPCHDVIMI